MCCVSEFRPLIRNILKTDDHIRKTLKDVNAAIERLDSGFTIPEPGASLDDVKSALQRFGTYLEDDEKLVDKTARRSAALLTAVQGSSIEVSEPFSSVDKLADALLEARTKVAEGLSKVIDLALKGSQRLDEIIEDNTNDVANLQQPIDAANGIDELREAVSNSIQLLVEVRKNAEEADRANESNLSIIRDLLEPVKRKLSKFLRRYVNQKN